MCEMGLAVTTGRRALQLNHIAEHGTNPKQPRNDKRPHCPMPVMRAVDGTRRGLICGHLEVGRSGHDWTESETAMTVTQTS